MALSVGAKSWKVIEAFGKEDTLALQIQSSWCEIVKHKHFLFCCVVPGCRRHQCFVCDLKK